MAHLVPPHTPEDAEQAGLYALDLLEGAERADFERHLATCSACQALVNEDRESLARLSAAAPERDPSPTFKAQLLARAARETVREPASAPRSWWSALFGPRAARTFSLAILFVLAVGLGTLLGQFRSAQEVLTSVALSSPRGSGGEATVVIRRSGAIELELRGLPPPPEGYLYEAWVIGAEGPPRPAGTATAGQATIRLTDQVVGNLVAITVEPSPGTSAPTSEPLWVGPVRL